MQQLERSHQISPHCSSYVLHVAALAWPTCAAVFDAACKVATMATATIVILLALHAFYAIRNLIDA